jgi:hypothetical protein
MVMNCPGGRMAGVLGAVAIALAASGASAEMISGNFCSVANVQNPPAGVIETMNWNDFTSVAGFGGVDSTSSVFYESGASAGVTVSWGGSGGVSQNTNDDVNRPGDLDDGHDELMTGYLQASKFGSGGYVPMLTLDVSNIDVAAFGGTYDVILYFDGDGDIEGTTGAVDFTIDDGVNPAQTVYGRDEGDDYALINDGSDPMSVYSEITSTDALNPTAGNYVMFTGLTGSDFSASLTGVANEVGVALNGFQIVPEPASLLLVAAGLLIGRRR